ncbi:MAG: MBL fold hydrolase [Azospira oryzae]|jgi:metallo-beta-lactamase family protein|nr:MAG: MBL fold hydrolase [Azospira oryzae]
MDIDVKFLGAAGSVTGSRYLITAGDFRFLFDCGLFQGLKELRLRNWDTFPIDAATIDAVVISHAHIDHTGYLPKLVREGFKGAVYCTAATADLMKIMLLDSAKLQEEEAAFAFKKGYSKHKQPQPLYTAEDAQLAFTLIHKQDYNERIKIHDRVEILYRNAGHLLGAAITEVYIKGDREEKKIVFSGDLGRQHDAMLYEPSAVNKADVLFIESTYGNKDNPSIDPQTDLARVVNETMRTKGVLLIPAFAVGRTQELLYYLHKLMTEHKIPDVPVYIDSPMAISTTYLFYRYQQLHKVKFNADEFEDELDTNMLVFVKTADHSKSLNELKGNAIIISSSGMMTGGRILHHLYHRLRKKQDTLLITGYQAEGTRGRNIIEGRASIRIFGEEVPVNCKVENMTSLSGHADKEELFSWMKNFTSPPTTTFTVHGEGENLSAYTQAIRERLKWNVVQPEYLQSISLFKGI